MFFFPFFFTPPVLDLSLSLSFRDIFSAPPYQKYPSIVAAGHGVGCWLLFYTSRVLVDYENYRLDLRGQLLKPSCSRI